MKDLKEYEKKEILDFNVLKKQFINYIDVSKNTIDTYSKGLKQFIIYMQENDIKNPTREDIINFREYLKEEHEMNTINGYMIALRQFFKFLDYFGIYKNITENVKGVKVEQYHRREYLTKEQCQEILKKTNNLREKTLFLLTLTCGLRANEVANIRLEDFKIKNNKYCLYVLGKGRDGKQDYVVIDNDIYDLIQEYINEYNITDYLFVSESNHNKGGQVATCTLRRIIKKMYERIGIVSKEYVFHSLRHSFATLSLQNGIDIREVSQGLRHKNIATTTIYSHDLERINNKCSNTISNSILGGI